MAQHDYVIANGTGAAVRSDLNNALAAIVSQNSGATAPATTYAFQFWADTTTGLLKLRNAANSAWITLFQLDGEWSTLPVENGTAAAPSIYFKDSGTDTGFYSPGTDQIGISTGGTARLTIDANGNVAVDTNTLYVDAPNNRVGIGTSSPANGRLNVSNTTNQITLDTTDTATYGRLDIGHFTNGTFIGTYAGSNTASDLIRFGTGGTTRMTLDASGRVGIGDTAPGQKLVLRDSGDVYLQIQKTGVNGMFVGSESSIGVIASDNPIVFRVGSAPSATERARIDSSGRLLVGTSSARSNFFNTTSLSGNLQLEGSTDTTRLISHVYSNNSANDPFLVLGKTRSTTIGGNTIVQSGDYLGGIAFQGSDGTELVSAVEIRAIVDGTPGANDMPGCLTFSVTSDGASSPTERMRIANNGTIFFHRTQTGTFDLPGTHFDSDGGTYFCRSDNPPIHVSRTTGNGDAVRFFRGSITQVGGISVTTTSTAFNTSSDYRLKENVTAVTDGITRLQQLKPSRFNFIADPDHSVDGFIAHEVQDVVPEAINGEKDAVDADGNPIYQGIDQSKLVPLLTAALQEAIGRIELLEAEVAALKAQ